MIKIGVHLRKLLQN